MRSRQLYSLITGSIAGTVYFDAPDNTVIRGVNFSVTESVSSANADYLELELSLSSSNQTGSNDVQGVIASASFANTGTGTPASLTGTPLNHYCPASCPVKKGERIYLNATESGNSQWRTRALVWFD